MRLVALAFVLGLTGCSAVEELAAPSPGDHLTLALEGGWSAEEKAEIAGALDAWRTASHGRVDVRIGADDADATLVRGPVDGAYDALSRPGRWMRIDADALARDGWSAHDGVGPLAGSLVGRMLGMKLHDVEGGYLSRVSITPEITTADVDSCRVAGFCP